MCVAVVILSVALFCVDDGHHQFSYASKPLSALSSRLEGLLKASGSLIPFRKSILSSFKIIGSGPETIEKAQ